LKSVNPLRLGKEKFDIEEAAARAVNGIKVIYPRESLRQSGQSSVIVSAEKG
jgi:hypothetical protein